MKQILDLNLDKIYTDFVLNHLGRIFKYIHPTVLTFLGLLTDFAILYTVKNQSFILSGILMFARYSFDCLDGAVARSYKKVSDFGGIMDTIADSTLIFILSYLILQSPIFALLITITNLLYLTYSKSLVHHHNIKKRGSNLHNIYRFGVNNNIIIYIISYFMILFIR
jgi:phosphatidylglycerophosphate synthase